MKIWEGGRRYDVGVRCYISHRGAVNLDVFPRDAVVVAPHKAEHTRQAKAVVAVRMSDEDLSDPRWFDVASLNLFQFDPSVPTPIHPRPRRNKKRSNE